MALVRFLFPRCFVRGQTQVRFLSTTFLSPSSSISVTKQQSFPSLFAIRRTPSILSHSAVRALSPSITTIRHHAARKSPYKVKKDLYPGCDYKHWLILVDIPYGATKQQMIDCYVQTLARVLGSEEEAKKKIYNVSCERYFGFGCEVSEEISYKLEGVPGVLHVLPDCYLDVANGDYGAELYVNGEIVQRSPERQRLVEPKPTWENQQQ